jgi:hypothetical protein
MMDHRLGGMWNDDKFDRFDGEPHQQERISMTANPEDALILAAPAACHPNCSLLPGLYGAAKIVALMEYPPGQNVPASHSEKADGFSARDICARNRRDDEFWCSWEREVAEGGRPATLPAVSKSAQFRERRRNRLA